MCDKAVGTYPTTIKFVPECFMTQEMCDKSANICFLVFNSIPDRYKTQKMCGRVCPMEQNVSIPPYCILLT